MWGNSPLLAGVPPTIKLVVSLQEGSTLYFPLSNSWLYSLHSSETEILLHLLNLKWFEFHYTYFGMKCDWHSSEIVGYFHYLASSQYIYEDSKWLVHRQQNSKLVVLYHQPDNLELLSDIGNWVYTSLRSCHSI